MLNGRRGRPGARLAVWRGAVRVGVVQWLGSIAGREDRAGGRRGFGRGRFRFEISADAYRLGAGRGDRRGVIRLGKAIGVYGCAAGRGDWRGVVQLEVIARVYDRAADRGLRHGVVRPEANVSYCKVSWRLDHRTVPL